MSEPAALPVRLSRHRSFMLFWGARSFSNGAFMMQSVAVGWQLYALTNDPLDLGLVGLVQFFPIVAMSVIAGQLLDLFDRRFVAGACQVCKAVAALLLTIGTLQGWLNREAMFAILFLSGTARAFEIPTMHAILPGIVPAPMLSRAIAASATASQTATICGPAAGGFLYAGLGPAGVYAVCTVVFVCASVLMMLVTITRRASERKPMSLETLFAGFHYVRAHPILLGAISMDLFAVLLGGVTALLPIYARDILDAGPWGLGLLRSAPAVGALILSVVLARYTIERRAGAIMFASVGLFGLATLVFALSTSMVLSLLALTVYGASDAVSVVIRQSLIQMRTPYDMLGRVSAVNALFTGSSGTLGEFRAGAVAASFGAVPSALIGGLGTIAIMAIWMWAFPQLRAVEQLSAERERVTS